MGICLVMPRHLRVDGAAPATLHAAQPVWRGASRAACFLRYACDRAVRAAHSYVGGNRTVRADNVGTGNTISVGVLQSQGTHVLDLVAPVMRAWHGREGTLKIWAGSPFCNGTTIRARHAQQWTCRSSLDLATASVAISSQAYAKDMATICRYLRGPTPACLHASDGSLSLNPRLRTALRERLVPCAAKARSCEELYFALRPKWGANVHVTGPSGPQVTAKCARTY